VRERKTEMVIDPNEWFLVMCAAKRRNELPVWKETMGFVHEDLDIRDEALEWSHCTAVEAANIAARKAYIAAFNETYDKEHGKAGPSYFPS
jgi:hypothetical protein